MRCIKQQQNMYRQPEKVEENRKEAANTVVSLHKSGKSTQHQEKEGIPQEKEGNGREAGRGKELIQPRSDQICNNSFQEQMPC